MAETDRGKALDTALGQIEKQFGKGSVMRMGENLTHEHRVDPDRGALPRPGARIGGLPRGRIVEIYGPESSGKSTLAMHVVAEAQRNGGICAYIDAEHAMDPVYAAGHRRQRRRPPHLPARHGGAGARDRRHADPLRRARRPRHRLGGGADAPGRDRGRDGRHPRRPAGAAHVPGAAQAHGHAVEVEHHRDLHQPAAGEDRRHVRLARRSPPAAARSSSTPRSASTSAGSSRSRTGSRWSATGPGSRS